MTGSGIVAGVAFCAGEAWGMAAGSGPFGVESSDAVVLITQVS